MGPRHLSRGNLGRASGRISPATRFNGATASQPWKYSAYRYVAHRVHTLQWGHGISAVEMNAAQYGPQNHLVSFNGATASQPWKSPHFHHRTDRNSMASMGPRHLSRGNDLKVVDHAREVIGFNGATASQPWKWHSQKYPFLFTFTLEIRALLSLHDFHSITDNVHHLLLRQQPSKFMQFQSRDHLRKFGRHKTARTMRHRRTSHHPRLPLYRRESLSQRFNALDRTPFGRTEIHDEHMVLLMIDHLD